MGCATPRCGGLLDLTCRSVGPPGGRSGRFSETEAEAETETKTRTRLLPIRLRLRLRLRLRKTFALRQAAVLPSRQLPTASVTVSSRRTCAGGRSDAEVVATTSSER